MFEMYLVATIALIAVGAGAGILAIYAIGIHSEEKAHSLANPRPDRLARGLRTVTAAYAHPRAASVTSRRAQGAGMAGRVRST